MIILFRGRPGVGKSTIADAFAKERKIPIIRKDDFYDLTATYVNDHATRNKISYDSLFKILESNISTDVSLILDYPFQKNDEVINLRDWFEKRNLYLVSVLVICSNREVWNERLNKRSENPAPNQRITNLDEMEKYYGNLDLKPLGGEIVVDTIKPVKTILKQLATQVPKKLM